MLESLQEVLEVYQYLARFFQKGLNLVESESDGITDDLYAEL
jgi:DNA-binding ferritin-like protein